MNIDPEKYYKCASCLVAKNFTELMVLVTTDLEDKSFLKHRIKSFPPDEINKRNSIGWTALMLAVRTSVEAVQYLIENGADVNIRDPSGRTALIMTVTDPKPTHTSEIVKLLLDNGADVNNFTPGGWSSLTAAAANACSFETIRLLLDNGADVNQRCINGMSSLSLIIRKIDNLNNAVETVRFLLENGADPNLQNNNRGITALMLASKRLNCSMIVELLLENGADPNLQNDEGYTALMMVSGRPDKPHTLEAVKLLLDNGADVNLRNIHRKTAVMMTAHPKVTGLIVSHIEEKAVRKYIKDVGKKILKKCIRQRQRQIFFHPDAFYVSLALTQARVRSRFFTVEDAFDATSEKMKDYFGINYPDEIMKIIIK